MPTAGLSDQYPIHSCVGYIGFGLKYDLPGGIATPIEWLDHPHSAATPLITASKPSNMASEPPPSPVLSDLVSLRPDFDEPSIGLNSVDGGQDENLDAVDQAPAIDPMVRMNALAKFQRRLARRRLKHRLRAMQNVDSGEMAATDGGRKDADPEASAGLAARMTRVEARLDKDRKTAEKAMEIAKSHAKKLKESNAEIQRLQTDYETLVVANVELHDEIAQLKEENEGLKTELNTARDTFNAIEGRDATTETTTTSGAATTPSSATPALSSELLHAPSADELRMLKQAMNKPPPFDGSLKSKMPIRDWLFMLQHYMDTMATSTRLRVSLAVSYLKDEALRFWNYRKALMPQEIPPKDPTVWANFEHAMLERFDAGNNSVAARYKLDKLYHNTQSMPAFVQQFDYLCSYIPNMTDEEKIHIFLTHAHSKVTSKIKTDPKTGQRWTHYNSLRAYALNEFADTLFTRAEASRAGLHSTTTRLRGGADASGSNKRAKTSPNKGNIQHLANRVVDFSRLKTIKPSSASGRPVQRPTAIVEFCELNKQCAYCFRPNHSAEQCRNTIPEGSRATLPNNMKTGGYKLVHKLE